MNDIRSYADLVILSIPTLRVVERRNVPSWLYVTSEQPSPLGWLARVVAPVATHYSNLRARRSFAEKERLLHLRFQNGSAVLHSGKDMLRFLICIGRDEPFGAKPP